MRVVITGHSADGGPGIVDDRVASMGTFPGVGELVRIWSADSAPEYPNTGTDPDAKDFFPPVGGIRVSHVSMYPTKAAEQVGGDLDEIAAGLGDAMDNEDVGMHVTDTIDFIYILSGSVRLEVGGDVTRLTAGDLLIQNGTRHRWKNDGQAPCDMLLFLAGAHRIP